MVVGLLRGRLRHRLRQLQWLVLYCWWGLVLLLLRQLVPGRRHSHHVWRERRWRPVTRVWRLSSISSMMMVLVVGLHVGSSRCTWVPSPSDRWLSLEGKSCRGPLPSLVRPGVPSKDCSAWGRREVRARARPCDAASRHVQSEDRATWRLVPAHDAAARRSCTQRPGALVHTHTHGRGHGSHRGQPVYDRCNLPGTRQSASDKLQAAADFLRCCPSRCSVVLLCDGWTA